MSARDRGADGITDERARDRPTAAELVAAVADFLDERRPRGL